MRELLILVKKDIVQLFSAFLNIKEAIKDKKRRQKFFVYILVAVSCSYSIKIIFDLFSDLYTTAHTTGRVFDYFVSMTFAFTIILTISIIPYSISKLYYSKGLNQLLTLPLKSRNILISSIFSISLSFFIYALFIFLPGMIKHQELYLLGPLYYVLGFLNLFFYSITICSIITLFSILIMRAVSKFPSAKNILQFSGMMIMFVGIFAIQGSISKIISSKMTNGSGLISMTKDVLNPILEYFPPLKFCGEGISVKFIQDALLSLAFNFMISIIAAFVVGIIANKLWIRGLAQMKSTSIRKVSKKQIESKSNYKKSSVMFGIAKRELISIVKTPVYLFNIGISGILIPLVLAIVSYFQIPEHVNIFSLIGDGIYGTFVSTFGFGMLETLSIAMGFGLGIGLLSSMYGSSASTSISREGSNMWLNQVLPIPAKDQVFGRYLTALIILAPTNLFFIGVIQFIVRAPLLIVLVVFLASVLSSMAVVSYSLLVDILHPKLNWDNPQQAVKQNLNLFISMMIDFAILALAGYVIFKISDAEVFNMNNVHMAIVGFTLFFVLILAIFTERNIAVLKKKISSY